MEIFECLKSRRSVREYDDKDVPDDLIGRILSAGVKAPSAGNVQPWEFVIVRDKITKSKLKDAALGQNHVMNAPVLIIICADEEKSGRRYGDRGKDLYCIQDTAACTQNMLLAGHALGLGMCWVGAFEEEKVAEILELPERLKPVAILTIGFPLPHQVIRKSTKIPFENLSWIGKYGKKYSLKIKPLSESLRGIKEGVKKRLRRA